MTCKELMADVFANAEKRPGSYCDVALSVQVMDYSLIEKGRHSATVGGSGHNRNTNRLA